MIGAYSQLLQREYQDKLDGRGGEFISYCVEGALRMGRLITDLLAYARAASTEAEFPRAQVDLNAVLKTVLANLQGAIKEAEAQIAVDCLPVVFVQETQIQQVLQNLLANAIKYRNPEVPSRIHISAEHRDSEWIVSVSDNGVGIEPENLEIVFSSFKRLHHDASSGTGLGLSICRRIIERHGGRIWVESEPSEGSTFRFTLPD